MKIQKDQSKIKSRINYNYYIDVLINIAIYGGIFFISMVMFINAIKIIINMLIKL